MSFEFYGVGRVVFGRGTFSRAGELAAGLGRSALVIHNGPAVEPLLENLSASKIKAIARRQWGEPVVADIDGAVEEARKKGCDFVIGIGGGSAIDAAKAVAGLLANGGSVVDYMEIVGNGRKITQPAAPWMAVPTTAGTGAEATRNAVVGHPEKHFKASVRSEMLLPRVALIDPMLAVSAPPAVTASCGMDALCQLIESYTSTGATPISDALALRGINIAARYLPRAFELGDDLEAREGMALAAFLSGMTLTSAGLGAVHGFAAPLGANSPIPHGTVCAALLPGVIAANVAALREENSEAGERGLKRYAEIGRQLPELSGADGAAAIEGCVRFVGELAGKFKIPALKTFGFGQASVPQMIALARKASSMRFNPVVLSDGALGQILLRDRRGLSGIRSGEISGNVRWNW